MSNWSVFFGFPRSRRIFRDNHHSYRSRDIISTCDPSSEIKKEKTEKRQRESFFQKKRQRKLFLSKNNKDGIKGLMRILKSSNYGTKVAWHANFLRSKISLINDRRATFTYRNVSRVSLIFKIPPNCANIALDNSLTKVAVRLYYLILYRIILWWEECAKSCHDKRVSTAFNNWAYARVVAKYARSIFLRKILLICKIYFACWKWKATIAVYLLLSIPRNLHQTANDFCV